MTPTDTSFRIAVIGLRGIPEVQGGVERHCQHLYPRLVRTGSRVTIIGRKPYISKSPYHFEGVEIVPIWSPRKKSLEAIVHTFLALIWIWRNKKNFDLIHIHAIGPALLTPLARLTGLKVVVTNHGPDYDRQKWGRFAKWVLRTGEMLGARSAHRMIAVSRTIRALMQEKHGADATYIPNGVILPDKIPSGPLLNTFGLTEGRYILAVGRLVPEKGFHDLIKAFSILDCEWKLAIVGDADHEDAYSLALKAKAKNIPNVVMTGFQKGEALGELYSNAGLFVLPSYHEGLPIVGLEAMSYKLPMILSDISANREIAEPQELFPVGDIEALANKIRTFLDRPELETIHKIQIRQHERLEQEFDWDQIAKKTNAVYCSVLSINSNKNK
jgi:glycosyltransferase involved in cell wall biosynthesis